MQQNSRNYSYRLIAFSCVLLIIYFINQIYALPKKEDLQVAIHNPTLSYDRKMAMKVGYDVYYFFKFIAENTPETAKIYKPPMMYPWPFIGNGGYASFFLYPRELINGELGDTSIPKEADYAVVIWSEVPADPSCQICGWPKAKYTALETMYYKESPPWGIARLK